MSMALLASKFRYLDLAQKSILFFTPSPRGVSTIGVTAAPAAVAPSTPTPPTGGFIDIKTVPQAFGGYHLLLVITCDQTNFTIAVPLRD